MRDYYFDIKKKKKLPFTKSEFQKAIKICGAKKGKKFDICLKKHGIKKKKK